MNLVLKYSGLNKNNLIIKKMKKRFYIKTAFFSLAAVALLSSCLKDSRYVNFGAVGTLVELPLAEVGDQASIGGPFQTPSFGLAPGSNDTLTVAVNVASPAPLSTPLTVTLSTTDSTYLSSYNTTNSTTYHVLPAADYTVIGGSLNVTIPAHARLGYLKILINAAAVGAANSGLFVLPVTIESASGQPIAQPEKNLLYNINIKNAYAGNYGINGFVFRDIGAVGAPVNDPALGGNFSGFTQELVTLSAYSVSWAPIWSSGSGAAGVGGTSLTVDPATNLVTISSTTNATLTNATGYTSRYDPAHSTFYISYTWGVAPHDRAETDTLVEK